MRTKRKVKNRAKAHIARVKAGRRPRVRARAATARSRTRRWLEAGSRRRLKTR